MVEGRQGALADVGRTALPVQQRVATGAPAQRRYSRASAQKTPELLSPNLQTAPDGPEGLLCTPNQEGLRGLSTAGTAGLETVLARRVFRWACRAAGVE